MKRPIFVAYTFIGSVMLFLSLGTQSARADWLQQGVDFLRENGSDIYHKTVSPNVIQYWTYTIPNNDVQRVKEQFRAAADGEFHRICTEHSADGDARKNGLRPLVLGSNDPSRFYFIQSREENGVVHCYRRGQR